MTRGASADEPRWAGIREVMGMSWPIILGTLSYTVMDFADKVMVAQLGPEALAAIGSAAVWSWTLGTVVFGIVTATATFVAQSLGRGRPQDCARYGWQGLYLSLLALATAVMLYPAAGLLFGLMNHSPQVTALETEYFRIRLFGYVAMACVMGVSSFFQAINRSRVPMYTAFFGNALNIVLNYALIFGKFGAPALGVAGAAIATVASQWVQAAMLVALFLGPACHKKYGTRNAWRFESRRSAEVLRIGFPAGLSMFLDIANWGIFVSFVVGYFGDTALAANNIAISFIHLSFMPAVAVNQGIAAIVGQHIGRGDIPRAKRRTYTALRISVAYMAACGLVFVVFGGRLSAAIFSDDPTVVSLAHNLLILAGIFQAFDGINIICMGALRGAGDTRWMMWATIIVAYFGFLPLSLLLAFGLNGGAYGAWLGATVYIVTLSATLFWRFRSERWRGINIFTEAGAPADDARPDTPGVEL